MRWLVLTMLVAHAGCGDDSGGGAADASPQLPGVAAYLDVSRYDCLASGPIVPPARPHALDCFATPQCTSPLVTGHRMANPFAPENSLAAARAAILLGVDIIETDVRMTSDNQVVLIHDGDVDRTTSGVGDVSSYSLAELQALALVPEVDDPTGDFSCERVPTLDELFAVTRDKIVVELEVKDTAAGVAAAEYLRDNGLYGQAFLLCDPGECAAARAAVPDVPIMTRPQQASEVATELDYEPAPIMVHIDAVPAFWTDAVLVQIHSANAKVFANAFVLGDGAALGLADFGQYHQLFAGGIDVIQSEFPHYALQALGRLAPAN